jgi:hypothetical protein
MSSVPDALPPLSYDEALNGPLPATGELLDSLVGVVRRFVVLTPEQLSVLALWVLHTHAVDAADTTPYLAITSPEKQSGKSRLLEVLAQLVARPMEAANISDAALFRALGGDDLPVTLLFDEIDAVFSKRTAPAKEELRGLINAGYRRGAVAWRCVGEGGKQEVIPFPVFGPKALAGIGQLPDTIADRSIPIRLRRKSREEKVARGRYKAIREAAQPLAADAVRWAAENGSRLKEATPALPDELSDRAQDGGEALVAIADLGGEEWGARARGALVTLHRDKAEEEASWPLQLLADIRRVFGDAERMSSAELLADLKEDETAPWASWGKGDGGLTARHLATLLRPYGIRPHTVRQGGTFKGYKREQFEDSWERYLPPETADSALLSVTADTSALQSQKPDLFYPSQDPPCDGYENGANPHSNAVVTGVTDRTASGEQEAEAERLEKKFGEATA